MKLKIILLMAVLSAGKIAVAQSKQVAEVAAAVEQLRQAMISGDSLQLTAIVAEDLTYGHSGGKIEDKPAFIHSFVTGHSDFVTIELSDQKIRVYENTGVVTHTLNATNNDNGVPGTVTLSILTVWHKNKGKWQLIARQAVKPH